MVKKIVSLIFIFVLFLQFVSNGEENSSNIRLGMSLDEVRIIRNRLEYIPENNVWITDIQTGIWIRGIQLNSKKAYASLAFDDNKLSFILYYFVDEYESPADYIDHIVQDFKDLNKTMEKAFGSKSEDYSDIKEWMSKSKDPDAGLATAIGLGAAKLMYGWTFEDGTEVDHYLFGKDLYYNHGIVYKSPDFKEKNHPRNPEKNLNEEP
ncbi:MAG: hypothetical protein PHT54_01975 [Candidatus Nanoarchaeia archaeon]|nr:hypothetical protein [Candidatus Nanoarchaeia archaeon]